MFCLFYKHLISAYRDDELSPFMAKMVTGHCARCAGCRAILEQVDSVRDGINRLETLDPPPAAEMRLMEDIASYEREREGIAPHIIVKPSWRKSLPRELVFSRAPAYAFARAAIVALLLLALTVTMLPDRSIAQALDVSGMVLVAPATSGDAWQYLSKNMKIYEGMKFRFTDERDYIDLRFKRSDEVIRIKRAGQGAATDRHIVKLRVRKGTIAVRPAKGESAATFKVHTPTQFVEIRGDTCILKIAKENGVSKVILEEVTPPTAIR